MSTLGGIEFTLDRILRSVRQLRLDAMAEGKAAKMTEPKGQMVIEQLQADGKRVALALRDLTSRQNLYRLREAKIHSVPGHARYAEGQSIGNTKREVERLLDVATRLKAEIQGLSGDVTRPTTADLIEGMQDVLGELGKQIDRAQLEAVAQQASGGPGYRAQGQLPSAIGAADLLTQIWLLLSCAVALTRGKRQAAQGRRVMAVDGAAFTPWASLAGGLAIGLAAALYLLANGRIAGIAGIVAAVLRALPSRERLVRQRTPLAFVAGLLLAPWVWRVFAPWPALSVDVGPGALVVAGLLVGIGVRMGNGCTSGHGVCGLSRLSRRSLVNVLAFMGAGFATVFVLRHLG